MELKIKFVYQVNIVKIIQQMVINGSENHIDQIITNVLNIVKKENLDLLIKRTVKKNLVQYLKNVHNLKQFNHIQVIIINIKMKMN